MKRWNFIGAVAAVIMMAMAPAYAEVLIATVGPITGQYASFGEQMQRGMEMAAQD